MAELWKEWKQVLVFVSVLGIGTVIVLALAKGTTVPGRSTSLNEDVRFVDGETVTVIFMKDEDTVEKQLVVASSPEKRQKGLSGRESIPAEGMLFVYPEERVRTFWMKEMSFPLDMLFVSADGVIKTIHQADPEPGVPVNQLTRYSSKVPVKFVIEVKKGFTSSEGIQKGDRVRIDG